MHNVRTSFALISELALGDTAASQWLSRAELAAYLAMRSPERRDTFLAGRITLKRLLLTATYADRLPHELTIESRSVTPGHGERPVLSIGGIAQPQSLSIAHSERGVLVACGPAATVSVGVDLVARGSVSQHVTWTFTAAERQWLASAHSTKRAAAELWARKEAFYKACQRGEGFQPGAIEVVPGRAPGYANFAAPSELLCLQTWQVAGHVAALAVATSRPAVAQQETSQQKRAA